MKKFSPEEAGRLAATRYVFMSKQRKRRNSKLKSLSFAVAVTLSVLVYGGLTWL